MRFLPVLIDDAKVCRDGETRCVEDQINTCIGGNWWGYTPCLNQKCEMQEDKAVCVNICENGDTQCIGNTLFECEHNVWPDAYLGMDCGDQKSCMSVTEFSFCANPENSQEIVEILVEHNIQCDENLLLCGENNSLYNCVSNELHLKQACGNQVCSREETGIMACIDACTPETTKCEGNNLVTCSADKVYGTPVPCETGTVCTLDEDGISACVERKQSFAVCDSPKCIGNTLYQCVDGIYDNGTSCGDDVCGLNDSLRYACLPSKVCEPGSMQCGAQNTPQQCNDKGKWENTEVSCGEEGFCVVRHNEAFCVCLDGYFDYESGICASACESGCSGNYAISCDYESAVQTYCAFGCNEETHECNSCITHCSEVCWRTHRQWEG